MRWKGKRKSEQGCAEGAGDGERAQEKGPWPETEAETRRERTRTDAIISTMSEFSVILPDEGSGV